MDVSSSLRVPPQLTWVRGCVRVSEEKNGYDDVVLPCVALKGSTNKEQRHAVFVRAKSPFTDNNNISLTFSLLCYVTTRRVYHNQHNSALSYAFLRSDGKHTVYGRVLDDASMLTVRKCEAVPVNGTEPRIPLRIVQCGEL
jgi:hypothetical protein